MDSTPTITFRGTRHAEPLEMFALQHLEKLQKFSPSIVGAHVVIERGHHHHRGGNHYHVRIRLTVPGEEILVAHDASPRAAVRGRAGRSPRKADEPDRLRRSAHVALRAAFASARRRLQDYERRRRGQVKAHRTEVA